MPLLLCPLVLNLTESKHSRGRWSGCKNTITVFMGSGMEEGEKTVLGGKMGLRFRKSRRSANVQSGRDNAFL